LIRPLALFCRFYSSEGFFSEGPKSVFCISRIAICKVSPHPFPFLLNASLSGFSNVGSRPGFRSFLPARWFRSLRTFQNQPLLPFPLFTYFFVRGTFVVSWAPTLRRFYLADSPSSNRATTAFNVQRFSSVVSYGPFLQDTTPSNRVLLPIPRSSLLGDFPLTPIGGANTFSLFGAFSRASNPPPSVLISPFSLLLVLKRFYRPALPRPI